MCGGAAISQTLTSNGVLTIQLYMARVSVCFQWFLFNIRSIVSGQIKLQIGGDIEDTFISEKFITLAFMIKTQAGDIEQN